MSSPIVIYVHIYQQTYSKINVLWTVISIYIYINNICGETVGYLKLRKKGYF